MSVPALGTSRKVRTSSKTHKHIRRVICQRWNELSEDLVHLERAINNLPEGVFTAEEQHDLELAAERLWDVFTNRRPTPRPSSAARRRRWEQRMKHLAELGVQIKSLEDSK